MNESFLTIVQEFASIVRGLHTGYRGDRRYNGGFFLYEIRYNNPDKATALAIDIDTNLMTYSDISGLPDRTLYQAVNVLFGKTFGL